MAANNPNDNWGPSGYAEEKQPSVEEQIGGQVKGEISGRLQGYGEQAAKKGGQALLKRAGIELGKEGVKVGAEAAGSAATGAAVGGTIGTFLGGPVGTVVVGALTWVGEKTIGWIKRHKPEAAIAAAAGLAAGAALGSAPAAVIAGLGVGLVILNLTPFFASLAGAIIITLGFLIAVPVILAFMLHIINTGAWVVPPWNYEQTTFDATPLDSPYIEVTKTPQPRFQYENAELLPNGIPVEYVITIVAERSVLTNISIEYNCSAINDGGNIPCPAIEAVSPDPEGPPIPDAPEQISPQDPFTFTYRQLFTQAGGFEDTRITDTITVTATAEGIDGERSAAQATVLIGEPPGPEECPGAGGEVSGAFASTLINGSVRYLPPSSQRDYCITPTIMTIHWSAGPNDNPNGTMATYNTLSARELSCLLGSDTNDVIVMIPMYQNQVRMAACSGGDWNNYAVDIEIAGTYFVAPPPPPNDDTINIAIDSVCKLMRFYGLNWTQVRGHYEIQPGKIDPGAEFLHDFFIPELRNRCPGI